MADQPDPSQTETRIIEYPLPRRDDAAVRELAAHILQERVWPIYIVPQEMHMVVFLPLLGSPFRGWTLDELHTVMVYGINDVKATAPRSVSGYPIFTQIHYWPLDDWTRAVHLAKAASDAQKAILAAPVPHTGEPAPKPAEPAPGPS